MWLGGLGVTPKLEAWLIYFFSSDYNELGSVAITSHHRGRSEQPVTQ